MIKHLIAFVLVASLGSASCASTTRNSNVPVMLDEETLQVIKQEVTMRLEKEAKTNKKVALAMQTEAAKRQLIAYFITGVLVAGGLAIACWYFWPKKASQVDATTPGAAKATQADPHLATGAATAPITASASPQVKTGTSTTPVAVDLNESLKQAMGDASARAVITAVDARCKVLIAEAFGCAADHVNSEYVPVSASTKKSQPLKNLDFEKMQQEITNILEILSAKPNTSQGAEAPGTDTSTSPLAPETPAVAVAEGDGAKK
ncbi:hypothetical protein FJ365_01605 [Candidatus Dependentiae bacterium]|nr:hypothetical protein [Candidatus Dependentiae bacterium]